MNRRMLSRIAASSLMLGIATVGCAPTAQMAHPTALADAGGADTASRAAAKARAALAAHKGFAAVDAAEKAVAAQPGDAAYRMLLGQSYLASGRFASAATSFRDSLTLSPEQPKARFDLALAMIAQGNGPEALTMLRGLDGAVSGTDLGLALAMAGDRDNGIRILTEVVRSGKSDARTRQNLALALALAGRWGESRAMAMQDTSPDRLNAQIAGWAELAKPQTGGPQQVAAMLGVQPASDPGLPTELAMAVPAPAPVDKPVALAMAAPAAEAAPAPVVAAAIPVAMAGSAGITMPAISRLAPNPVTVPFVDLTPANLHADAPAATAVLVAQRASKEAMPAPPPLLRARPMLVRQVVSVPAPARRLRGGGYVVQLGAYAKASAMQAAWERASRLMPKLAGYEPTRAEFSFAGGSLVRLSVSGFDNRADAVQLCEHVHARGGQCFVRQAAGDSPLQWTRRDERIQVASR
jgi:Flp pilus assembly protein TadD